MPKHTLLPVWLFPPCIGWLKIDQYAWLPPLFLFPVFGWKPLDLCHFGSSPEGLQKWVSVTNTVFQGLSQVCPPPPRPWTWKAPSPVPHPSSGFHKCQPLLMISLVLLSLVHTWASRLGFTFHCWHLLQQSLTHLAPKAERQCFPITVSTVLPFEAGRPQVRPFHVCFNPTCISNVKPL